MSSLELHDKLNPKIWNSDNSLRSDVRNKILDAVDEFLEVVEVPITLIDVHLVGSNASYNYTDNSDLDAHCIVNFSRIDADPTVVESWMWAEKKLFNDEYDIKIRGIELEIYVEDVHAATVSNGIYSLFDDEWIKFPEPIEAEIDEGAIAEKVDDLGYEIDSLLLTKHTAEDVEDMIDKLYLLRKNGLATDGEYGVDNQTFKELRNQGYIDDLKDELLELKSEELSILSSKQ